MQKNHSKGEEKVTEEKKEDEEEDENWIDTEPGVKNHNEIIDDKVWNKFTNLLIFIY